jgi:signal recognition particle subunit SRP54
MFQNLSDRLQAIFSGLTGKGRLTEEDVDAAMREIRMALLEADVNYKVVKEFVAKVRERAVGSDVMKSLTPGQQVIKIVLDELTALLGGAGSQLVLSGRVPNVVMLVGLQGSGKTTATAKLANLMRKQGKRPLMVACDVYRPAAIDQLEALGKELDIPVYRGQRTDVVSIAKAGVRQAVDTLRDFVIVDTAGRLHIDEVMMAEAIAIRNAVKPDQILMVVDAMTGQDAVNVAAAFAEQVIKFASFGEKPDSLELFYPDRMAKRILGMGDVVSLIEKAQEVGAAEMDAETTERMKKADFTFDDFLTQIVQVRKMGGIGGILKSLPGMNKLKGAEGDVDEGALDRIEAIIFSMSAAERAHPKIINGSRRERIARGSGVQVYDVNQLIKQFAETRKLMKQFQGQSGKGKRRMRIPGMPSGF